MEDNTRYYYKGIQKRTSWYNPPAACFLGFMISYNVTGWTTWYRQNDRYAKWETAFCNCPDLGWDYFKHIQAKEEDASTISSGGACRFHDHSDIPGWVCRNHTECPYPQGAPVDMPPVEEEHEKELTEEDAAPAEHAIGRRCGRGAAEPTVDYAVLMDAAPEDALVFVPENPDAMADYSWKRML